MARKEVITGLQDFNSEVGFSSDGELLVPAAGVRTRSGDPVQFPMGAGGLGVYAPAISLYVSASGSDSNTGLSASSPLLTLQAASDKLEALGAWFFGSITINMAAGTYTADDALFRVKSFAALTIKGPSVGGHPNVPTAIIDGTGGGAYENGLTLRGSGVYVTVQDIKFQNFTSGNTRCGIFIGDQAIVSTNNVHADNCDWAGINIQTGYLRQQGGIIQNCRYGTFLNDAQGTVGYGASSTATGVQFLNNTWIGVAFTRGSQGHLDYCILDGNSTGLYVHRGARCNANSNNFKNNSIGVEAKSGGHWDDTSNVFNDGTADANNTNVKSFAYSGETNLHELAFSEIRVAQDATNYTHTASGKTTLSTPYTIPAYRFTAPGQKYRIVCAGVFGATPPAAGSSLNLDFGATAMMVLNPTGTPQANQPFFAEFNVHAVSSSSQLVTGWLSTSNASPRVDNLSKSAAATGDLDVKISWTHATTGGGQSVTLNRVEVFKLG